MELQTVETYDCLKKQVLSLYSQEQLVEALDKWMIDKGLSARKAAKILGVTHSTVSRWGQGTKIREKHIEELLPHLKSYLHPDTESKIAEDIIDAYELLKKASGNKHLVWMITTQLRSAVSAFNDAIKEVHEEKRPIPYTNHLKVNKALGSQNTEGIPAAAGIGNDEQIIRLPIDEAEKMNYEGVFVDGESMEPTFNHGDRVWLKKTPTKLHLRPVEKPEVSINTIRTWVKDGSIIMCELNQQGRMLKRIHYFEEKGKWTIFLTADNDEWSKENDFPYVVTRDDDLIIYGEIIARTLI